MKPAKSVRELKHRQIDLDGIKEAERLLDGAMRELKLMPKRGQRIFMVAYTYNLMVIGRVKVQADVETFLLHSMAEGKARG